MENETIILIRLLLAALAGSIIGLERTFHGRPAGFRTHVLVCLASGLLMLLTVFQWQLLANAPLETVRVDPTRMAQGIMTGIGFLGAGVILKENLSVRGLTTAASIWITAAIGIMIGMGFYFPAFLATLITLGTLSVFRWLESVMPTEIYGRLSICFLRGQRPSKAELYAIAQAHGVKARDLGFQLEDGGRNFRYEMTIRTRDRGNFERLAKAIEHLENVEGFSLKPTGS